MESKPNAPLLRLGLEVYTRKICSDLFMICFPCQVSCSYLFHPEVQQKTGTCKRSLQSSGGLFRKASRNKKLCYWPTTPDLSFWQGPSQGVPGKASTVPVFRRATGEDEASGERRYDRRPRDDGGDV